MTWTDEDERRHPPGPELQWSESWTFDFAAADASLGGWARLQLWPNRGTAWHHAFLAGPDRQLVAVIDHEVPVPGDGLEIRTDGLWATHICETPHDHWTLGLEAFGLGVDDPCELYGRQFGDQVPLGFDLEWEAAGPLQPDPVAAFGYEQSCRVSGDVLVGRDEIGFDGIGRRAHQWGPARIWDQRWFRIHGVLGDGTTIAAAMVDGDLALATGRVAGESVEVVAVRETMTGTGLPGGARVDLGGLAIDIEPVAAIPFEVVDVEQRVARTPHALCRLVTADGRRGVGWAAWNVPRA